MDNSNLDPVSAVAELDAASVPVLTCEEAGRLEQAVLAGDERREWAAMVQAGRAIARAALADFGEIGAFPSAARVLVLAGKGHNGGDALIAAAEILRRFPNAKADVCFVFGSRSLRPLAGRGWRSELCAIAGDRVRTIDADSLGAGYDLCLDGVFGFQFRPPVDERVHAVLERVNAADLRFRAAVDLPSADVFRADFTYATGSVKAPALLGKNAGRVRYLDLGFFEGAAPARIATGERVLTTQLLEPLARLRSAHSDKRTYGHLFLIGGSRSYPGAILMATLAALRAGAGLVTTFVPESLVPAYAARLPEAMWVGCPETPDGNVALEALHLVKERLPRATALVAGPGLARERETLLLVEELLRGLEIPAVLDADALQTALLRAAKTPLILTPHAGEFERIAGGEPLERFAAVGGRTVILKGPVTRIAGARRSAEATAQIYVSLFGGPVLARGGSGDLLSGIVGGLLAQSPAAPLLAAARGALWHGLAADRWARQAGQVAVHTSELLDHLGPVLREAIGRERA